MKTAHRLLVVSLAGFTLWWAACSSSTAPPETAPTSRETLPERTDIVAGRVVDQNGRPVELATVRLQTTRVQALTDSEGRFVLAGMETGRSVTVSAWKDKYYCAKSENATPPIIDLRLRLRRYQVQDNPAYEWVSPVGENSCFSCKPGLTQVWLDSDAHGKSARNHRFLTMYNGMDIMGNKSSPTRFTQTRDYGRVPIPPDPRKPYYGPGYKLDFPDNAGNCAACHAPGAAMEDPYGTDPNRVQGTDKYGIHCDFCHKVADVRFDPSTGMPAANMPGVLSMDIRRPFPDDMERYQLFFGTFDDDNVPEEDTRLPLIEQSQFCAPCHFGVFWNTVVYDSFGEWLRSPYSDPATGKTCQQCHTPAPTIVDGRPLTNVAPAGKGGVERDPMTIHAHTFPGAGSGELLRKAVTVKCNVQRLNDSVEVEVRITNDKTGHHVPSDSPLRHLILIVLAHDDAGRPLALLAGDRLPYWCGTGEPQDGCYSGLPGRAFAKILMELWTEVAPTGAYWNPTRILSDNRLAAFATDTSHYVFAAPETGGRIRVTLIFRRAFIQLAEQKAWNREDTVMDEQELAIPPR